MPLLAESLGSGTLWRVRERGGTVWLAGSLHQLRASSRLPPTYEQALTEAERLVMEIDLDDLDPGATSTELVRRALLPPDRSLRTVLGPQRWARLQPRLAELGMPEAVVERLRPWAVAMLLTSAGLARGGASPASGVESQLLRRAVAERKPVEGLETVAFQLDLFDGLSEADQLQMLDRSLAEFDAMPAQLEALERTWRRGDPAALEALLQRQTPERSRPVMERFVTRRNAAWLPRILELLRRGDDTLVVVGALHLIGEQGLVALLRRRGLQVERVERIEQLSPPAPAGAARRGR